MLVLSVCELRAQREPQMKITHCLEYWSIIRHVLKNPTYIHLSRLVEQASLPIFPIYVCVNQGRNKLSESTNVRSLKFITNVGCECNYKYVMRKRRWQLSNSVGYMLRLRDIYTRRLKWIMPVLICVVMAATATETPRKVNFSLRNWHGNKFACPTRCTFTMHGVAPCERP
jgi:hypothetical protein